MFLSFVVSFLVDMFNQKAPLQMKITSGDKSKTYFGRELSEINVEKFQGKILSLAEAGALQSCL